MGKARGCWGMTRSGVRRSRPPPSASLVVLLDVELTDAEAAQVSKAGTLVVFGTVQSQELAGASVVLPVTNVAEEMRDLRQPRSASSAL